MRVNWRNNRRRRQREPDLPGLPRHPERGRPEAHGQPAVPSLGARHDGLHRHRTCRPARTSTASSSPTRSATWPTRRGRRHRGRHAAPTATTSRRSTPASRPTTGASVRPPAPPLRRTGWASSRSATLGTTVPLRGEPGAIADDSDTASTFTGVEHQLDGVRGAALRRRRVHPRDAGSRPRSQGGRIVGWSNRNTQGNSSQARPPALHRQPPASSTSVSIRTPRGSW